MISPELLRRYPVFAGLSHENIVTLANCAEEISVAKDHLFFHEGDELHEMYLVLEGAVGVIMELPAQNVTHLLPTNSPANTKQKTSYSVRSDRAKIFGWSGLVAPYETMAGAEHSRHARVVAFDCVALLEAFKADCHFGLIMMQKTAQVIRDRLRDRRMESLAQEIAP